MKQLINSQNRMRRYIYSLLLIVITFDGFAVHFFGNVDKYELRERIYLQTDKHLYLSGEQVLMKVFTTDTEQIPIALSKIAYVELVDDSIARIQIMIELTDGTSAGRIQLPTNLPTGYYRLIAYTQFMKNEGIDVFFEKKIAVINVFQSNDHPVQVELLTENNFSPAEENEFDMVSLQPDKTSYTTRERGELLLNGLPENIHTLSVSIAGKEFLPIGESDISLFLKNQTKKSTTFTGEFLPEYEGHIITGKIIDNQIENAGDDMLLIPCISFPEKGIRFFAGQKNNTEYVRFFTSGISGTKEIATIVYNTDERYRLDIQSPFVNQYTAEPTPALRLDSAYNGQLLERSVALQVLHYFSENLPAHQHISEPYFKMLPTCSYLLSEYTRFMTMREIFSEFIVGSRFRKKDEKWELSVLVKKGHDYIYGTMPLVLLDGVPISDHSVIYGYDPFSVERINIYYGPIVLGGYTFDGIVELTTYRHLHQDLQLNGSLQILTYEAPQLPYRLDTPDYSMGKNRQSRIPDGRHTLLWNPNVQTDGKTSIRLPFDTSDLTGEFQATMEGVTKDGEMIYTTSFFTVDR